MLKNETQQKVDTLIQKYAEHVVWTGYIDIIVSRENYITLIDWLTDLWISVFRVTWWCCCNKNNEVSLWCPHGGWWPWFKWWHYSEIYWEYDIFEKNTSNIKQQNTKIKDIITNKEILDSDNTILNFRESKCLTPAIWLDIKWDNSFKDKRN